MEERNIRIRAMQTNPAVEVEFLELDRHYEVIWAQEMDNGWAVSLEKASPEAPGGTAPYRARAMDKNVRSGWHNPIRGLNYYRNRTETLREGERSARTLFDDLIQR